MTYFFKDVTYPTFRRRIGYAAEYAEWDEVDDGDLLRYRDRMDPDIRIRIATTAQGWVVEAVQNLLMRGCYPVPDES